MCMGRKEVSFSLFLPNTHTARPDQHYFPYLHNHEYFALDRVLLVSVGVYVHVMVARAHTKHRPAPTGISQSKAKRVQEYVVAGRCLLM